MKKPKIKPPLKCKQTEYAMKKFSNRGEGKKKPAMRSKETNDVMKKSSNRGEETGNKARTLMQRNK